MVPTVTTSGGSSCELKRQCLLSALERAPHSFKPVLTAGAEEEWRASSKFIICPPLPCSTCCQNFQVHWRTPPKLYWGGGEREREKVIPELAGIRNSFCMCPKAVQGMSEWESPHGFTWGETKGSLDASQFRNPFRPSIRPPPQLNLHNLGQFIGDLQLGRH